MPRFLYPVLRPLMRLLRIRSEARLRQLPQPKDAPNAHALGPDPDRVLLFGSGLAIGYGVLSNDLAIPGNLARQLSAMTGRGVDLDVVADTEITVRDSLAFIRAINVWRYDAIVLAIGVNDALLLTPVARWREYTTELLEHISRQLRTGAEMFVVGVPPLRTTDAATSISGWFGEQHGVTLNRETIRIAETLPNVTFVPFSPDSNADDLWNRAAETYKQWAALIAQPIAEHLVAEPRSVVGVPRINEQARQAAVEALGILNTGREERFDRIAQLASQLFDTEYSTILFIDGDRQKIKAGINVGEWDTPREGSFSSVTIYQAGVLVVHDAPNDARFNNYPYVKGEPYLRFYAGYPIETARGERVGVISVYDRQPRSWTDEDTELLRDLALMVQRELAAD